MTGFTADANGEIRGRFTVPADVPVGTKAVAVQGERVSGQTSYTGNGVITITERRRVTTLTTVNWNDITNITNITNVTNINNNTNVWNNIDPLAQTFTLEENRHIAGADLWFKALGTLSVLVQIRETTAGVPNGVVLSHRRLAANQINADGVTRVTWEPVWLEAGREYALVILTDDAEHALAVAEVGKKDENLGFITSQTYHVGVLLSSANASTWTAHQFADMTFRLLAAKFVETEKTQSLGSYHLNGYTDLMILASVERTAGETDVDFTIGEHRLKDNTPLPLNEPLANSPYQINCKLSGSEKNSPVVYPGVQLAAGRIRDTGTYVSRAMPCGTDARITVRLESLLPGTSSVTVELEINGVWQEIPLHEGEPVGDGWEERTFLLTPVTSDETRVKLTLTGSAKDRPKIRELRVITNDA